MAKNIADEITEAEAKAKDVIQAARAEGARILAKAKTESEDMVKAAKQNAHRSFRDSVIEFEREADEKAEMIMEKGRSDAIILAERHGDKVPGAASWIAEEVIARYGSRKG